MKATVCAKALVRGLAHGGPSKARLPGSSLVGISQPHGAPPRPWGAGHRAELDGPSPGGHPLHMGTAHPAVCMPSERSPEGITEEARWAEGGSCVPVPLAGTVALGSGSPEPGPCSWRHLVVVGSLASQTSPAHPFLQAHSHAHTFSLTHTLTRDITTSNAQSGTARPLDLCLGTWTIVTETRILLFILKGTEVSSRPQNSLVLPTCPETSRQREAALDAPWVAGAALVTLTGADLECVTRGPLGSVSLVTPEPHTWPKTMPRASCQSCSSTGHPTMSPWPLLPDPAARGAPGPDLGCLCAVTGPWHSGPSATPLGHVLFSGGQ